jgi:hypothetical protein
MSDTVGHQESRDSYIPFISYLKRAILPDSEYFNVIHGLVWGRWAAKWKGFAMCFIKYPEKLVFSLSHIKKFYFEF